MLHCRSSWLFISRRGCRCRRWMFLWTSEGMHSTCRFSAVVSWTLLLIELGRIIFSKFYWKSPVWRQCDFTPTFAQIAWLFLCCICIFTITDNKMFFGAGVDPRLGPFAPSLSFPFAVPSISGDQTAEVWGAASLTDGSYGSTCLWVEGREGYRGGWKKE